MDTLTQSSCYGSIATVSMVPSLFHCHNNVFLTQLFIASISVSVLLLLCLPCHFFFASNYFEKGFVLFLFTAITAILFRCTERKVSAGGVLLGKVF